MITTAGKKKLGNRCNAERIMSFYKPDVMKQNDKKEQLSPPYTGADILKTKGESSQELTQTETY